MKNQPEELVRKAVARLIMDQPFFGAMCLKMRIKADPDCETLWTDGLSIGFNPAFVTDMPLETVKGVLAHNIMHLVLEHHLRLQDRDPSTWNRAADYPVNKILEESGFSLPDNALTNLQYGTMHAEAVYSEIYFKTNQQNQSPNGNQNNTGNNGQQKTPSDPGGCGEVRQPPSSAGNGPPSSADLSKAQADNRTNIAQAYNIAKAIGDMPMGLKRLIEDEILTTKIDWRDVLRDFVDVTAKSDYTWTTPNQRYLPLGFYLPSLNSKDINEIVVAIDTSGSIRDDILQDFAGEIRSIIDLYPNTIVKVIYCDSEVYEDDIQTFEPGSDVTLSPVGGGGTAFIPVFEYIEKTADKMPVCLIYLTDMECYRFPGRPDYPVLWVQHGSYENPPPFGEHIKIPC